MKSKTVRSLAQNLNFDTENTNLKLKLSLSNIRLTKPKQNFSNRILVQSFLIPDIKVFPCTGQIIAWKNYSKLHCPLSDILFAELL